jgi:hypothetical protein
MRPGVNPRGVVNRAEMERVISIIDNYAYSALITRTFIPCAVIPTLGGEADELVIEGANQEAERAVCIDEHDCSRSTGKCWMPLFPLTVPRFVFEAKYAPACWCTKRAHDSLHSDRKTTNTPRLCSQCIVRAYRSIQQQRQQLIDHEEHKERNETTHFLSYS